MSDFLLTSPAFGYNGTIPLKYTYTGFSKESLNYSPPLAWKNAPRGTKSFAVVCKDPDAVGGTFTHWVLYGIPRDYTVLAENLPKDSAVYTADHVLLCQGLTDYMSHGYQGPNPPFATGVHRYIFTLYALSIHLKCDPGMTSTKLEAAISHVIVDQVELIGLVSPSQ